MQSIAVIGAGAIGGIVAARLAQRPDLTVTVCVRTPFERLEVDTPDGPIHATPEVWTEPGATRPVDWVLIATKAYDAAGAAAWLPGLVGPGTRVVVLQNGVEHAARFPGVAVVPAIVDIPAERTAPGRILQRRHGTILVPAGIDGEAFAGLFAGMPIAVSTTPDIKSQAWRKLCINCAGAISALVLKSGDVVAGFTPTARIMADLVSECMAVGRAEGALLEENLPRIVVEGYAASAPGSMNSMHADRLAGRRLEVDARNGVIVRLGERHGIPTPVNRMIVALLEVGG